MILRPQKPIIYIVDDNIVSEFATKIVLDQASILCEVFSFDTAESALESLSEALDSGQEVPNIILLDLKMPGMDGWDFLAKLDNMAAQIDNLAIYTVSNFTNAADRQRANEHPFVKGYVERPLTLIEIEKILSVQQYS